MADDSCGHAGYRAVGLDTLEHDTACTNSRPLADGNVSEQLCIGTDIDASADFRVTIAAFFPSTSKRNSVQHRHIITDDGRLADHDTYGVIDKDAGSDRRRRVNVDAKDFTDATLNVVGQSSTVTFPQRVSDSVGLNC